ncbi:MAG: thiol reductant ABC exporter subunit CydC [Chloroflexota bacterium]
MTKGVRFRIALAALIGMLGVPVAVWRLKLTANALFSVFQGGPFSELTNWLILIGVLVVIRNAMEYLRDEIADRTAAQLKVDLRERIYQHVLKLGAGHFDQRRTGDAVNALVESVERLDVFFGRYLPLFLTAAITPFVLFAFMAVLDLTTAFVFFFFAIFTLLAPMAFHRVNERRSMKMRTAQNELSADFLDAMQGLPTLKVFGQSGRRGEELAERARNVFHTIMHVLAINIGTTGITMFGIIGGSAVALAWGALRVQSGDLEFRPLLLTLMLGIEVFRPLQQLTRVYHQGMVGAAAARTIYDLLDEEPVVTDPPQPSTTRGLKPEIHFENVSFSYDERRGRALKDCSFSLKSGETLGVVGPSGAGKSTIVSLVMRFADPTSGRILLDHRDIREIEVDELREMIAVVTQETYLFDGTIADNLRIGKPDASLYEMREAARMANADEFISSLPDGYDTLVGERGTRLSGGQRQRIAIARAILKDAPILLLDEALSSVDAENEATIQQALERLQAGRTTLVIAHRLSSVVQADRIIVLEEGRIVETGTHRQLVERNGVYARLIEAQRDIEAEREGVTELTIDSDRQRSTTPPVDDRRSELPAGSEQRRKRRYPTTEIWRRLLALVKPWPAELAAVIGSGMLHALALLAHGVIGALLVGKVFRGDDLSPEFWLLIALIPLTALFTYLDIWLAHDLAYRLLAEMRIKLYAILDRLSPAYMYKRKSGDLLGTAVSDIELIELYFAHTLVPGLLAIVVPGIVLTGLFIIHWSLALMLLPFLVAVALTPMLQSRLLEQLGHDMRDQNAQLNAHMVDSIQGLRTIAAFGYGRRRLEEIRTLGERLADIKHKLLTQQSLQFAIIESMTGLGSLAVLSLGAWHVSNGTFERTTLPVATLLALSAFAPIANLATVIKELAETDAAARRYFEIEDEEPAVDDGPGESLPPTSGGRAVAFEGVTFRYGPKERPALLDVSFDVEPGQTIALVGGSGAGKTTVAHLLLRYWDPEWGRITIDGRNIRDFSLDDLRREIALVAQDTYLFHDTLWENLRIGDPDASDAEVLEAARLANVDDFVGEMPDGYQTLVGERGLQLSGGQRQRVAIARALLKDAPILILDEATSHLDAVNEAQVRDALENLQRGRTTIVIAHRLSTIRNADRIIVLDRGRVVEEGTHQQLLALDGMYSALIAAQLRGMARVAHATESPADGD